MGKVVTLGWEGCGSRSCSALLSVGTDDISKVSLVLKWEGVCVYWEK